MSLRRELVVSGYIRKLQDRLQIDIPNDIWLIVIMFYPNCIEFEGNTMNLTSKQKEMVTKWFIDIFELQNKSSILTSKLLYNFHKDGTKSGEDDEGTAFHHQCDGHDNIFCIIETEFNGHIFGCFISKKLDSPPGGKYMADDKAFLCVINSCFNDKGPAIYRIKPDKSKYAYYNVATWGPAFAPSDLSLFSFGSNVHVCNHSHSYFDEELCGNMLCGGTQYSDIGERREFKIKEFNVFTINIT